MKNVSCFLLIISWCLYQVVFPQIVVVRKNSSKVCGSLTLEDISDERISKILLKYTWPSCIAQDLTEEEKTILLKPNFNNTQEKFIRSKLKELSPDLDIVFVPDTLYELFLIKNNPMLLQDPSNIEEIQSFFRESQTKMEDLRKKENFTGSLVEFVKNKINEIYNNCNLKFFSKQKEFILALKAQKEFIEFLLAKYPDEKFILADDFSLFIEEQIKNLVDILVVLPNLLEPQESLGLGRKIDNEVSIFLKSINLDYLAHAQNRAVLLRSSSFINKESIFKGQINPIGSTIHVKKTPYSISFGNSLFAGYVYDPGACVYEFIVSMENDNKLLSDSWKQSVIGYALIINKFEYVDNYISNLFFISALSLEAALFGKGEFFHSRTKPAILQKDEKTIFIKGIPSFYSFSDPLGIFLITRDPYKQAKLFSDYLARHMIILQEGNITSLSAPEIQGLHELFNNQKQLTEEYTLIEFLNAKVRERKKRTLFSFNQQKQQQILPIVASNFAVQPNTAQSQVAGFNFLKWIYNYFQKN